MGSEYASGNVTRKILIWTFFEVEPNTHKKVKTLLLCQDFSRYSDYQRGKFCLIGNS